jgi:chromosome partitioning protein
MFVYAITNHKGGVGKTTAAATLGAAFARSGRRVLLVDLDPQSSLTAATGAAPLTVTVEHALLSPRLAAGAIVACASGMEILPARVTLATTLVQIAQHGQASTRLATALHTLRDRYDTVIVDCMSAMGAGMTNGLTAADVALVPIECDFLSLRGLADIEAIAANIVRTTNPRLQVRAFASMYDRRTGHASDVLAEARAAMGPRMLATLVPRSVRLAEAPAMGATVLEYAPRSLGAMAYGSMALELIEWEKLYGTTGRHTGGDTPVASRFQRRGDSAAERAAASG